MLNLSFHFNLLNLLPNGWRYPLVDGTRQHRFDGTGLSSEKCQKMPQNPTRQVHALLGAVEF
jgi:hypothetical protein